MSAQIVDLKMNNEDKNKALEAAIGQIEKAFGKGSVMKLGQRESVVDVQAISTGSLGLDIALGIGGFPKDVSLRFMALNHQVKRHWRCTRWQKRKSKAEIVLLLTRNMHLTRFMPKKLGVDLDELLISQPDAGEQALEIADTLVRSGAIDVLVVDSVAALVPRAELEGEMGDTHVGLQARLMSQALRKLTSSIARSNCLVIFINQIRLKIGVMFGNQRPPQGGTR